MSQQHYEPEFKQQIVRLHIDRWTHIPKSDGRVWSLKSKHLQMVQRIQRRMLEKCLKKPTAQNDLELMKENRRLREELAEAKKENLFLKKATAFFAKGID